MGMLNVASEIVFWRHARSPAGTGADVRSAPLAVIQHPSGTFGNDLLLTQDPPIRRHTGNG
jgi:hypothetical protein